LLVLVWLSEILRNVTLAVASGWSSGIAVLMAYSVLTLLLFAFVIVPLTVLSLWSINPLVIKKLFVTFGLSEKMLDKKRKTENPKAEQKN
jgi:hypothetical protein